MMNLYLLATVVGALTLVIVYALQVELEMPWPVAAGLTLPMVIAGIGLARGLTMLTDLPVLYVAGGLGIVLYLLAGGYEAIKKPH